MVRRPWHVLLAPVLLCLVLIPFAAQVTERLTALGWTPEDADSHRVQHLIEQEFGRSTVNHYILFSDPSGELRADEREFRLAVEQAVRSFRNDPDVADVYTWGSTRSDDLNRTLISEDRSMSLAIIVMEENASVDAGDIDRLESRLASDTLDVRIGGWPATSDAFLDLAQDDLIRAEIIALPITLVLLLVIFGGVVAAGLPIALALLSMVVTLAILALLSRTMMVNIFSINAVTMLGLAVGIDYALIMVSRFREEAATTPVAESVPRVMETAGRAVIVAGITVAIGLLGLVLFGVPAALSTGIAGACVVVACILLSLTALPAIFVLSGHRIARGRRRSTGFQETRRRPFEAIHGFRRRHPLVVMLVCGALLFSLAAPLRHIVLSSPTMSILPQDTEARIVYDNIAESFPHATTSPVLITVEPVSGSMMNANNLASLQTLNENLMSTGQITAVDSVWGYIPPGITPDAFATSLLLEPELVAATAPLLTPNAALINLTLDSSLDANGRRDMIAGLRNTMPDLAEPGLVVRIGGDAALDLDLTNLVRERAGYVVAFVIGLTWIALFAQFRSIFLPFKAIMLNLASLSASFGALVWIFQDGHLSRLLAFEPTGYTVILVPILMFCFLFGLSMDFEIIILSRIREAWDDTRDNTRAIDIGLDRAAHIVTASACVLLVVFLAFGTSQLQLIKSLGIGLSIAIFIDATIIRLLLLPATMQIMGKWNWWLPLGNKGLSPSEPCATSTGVDD